MKKSLVLSFGIAALFILVFSKPLFVHASSTSEYTPVTESSGYLNAQDGSGNLTHIIGGPDIGTGEGGVNADVLETTAGDYCNYYTNSSARISGTNSTDQSSITGLTTGTTYANWQEGDSSSGTSGNTCQTYNGAWGFNVSSVSSNCTSNVVCGMHHFVRLSGDIRPWSTTTVPTSALSFSANVKAQTASNVTGGAVGYFCPILQDSTTTRYVEYCFVEWRTGSGFPGNTYACSDTNPSGNNIDTIWTNISANQSYGTERPGAAGTTQTIPSNDYQSASISAGNLSNAISLINSPSGCNRTNTAWGPDSTDVTKYRVIGFEDGVEGGGFTQLGGSVSNENLFISTDTLYPNDELSPGAVLYDSSGDYKLTMQTDGNLVDTLISNGSHPWYSGTAYGPGTAYAIMQPDGNFVIYPYQGGTALGNTGTSGNSGAYAILQSDGNFVIYLGSQYKWAASQHTPYGF